MSIIKCCFNNSEVSDILDSMVQKCADTKCKLQFIKYRRNYMCIFIVIVHKSYIWNYY